MTYQASPEELKDIAEQYRRWWEKERLENKRLWRWCALSNAAAVALSVAVTRLFFC